jgi:hypothetical protein
MSATISTVLSRDLEAARVLDRDLQLAFIDARGRIRTPARTRELAAAFELARGRAFDLARHLDRAHAVAAGRTRNIQMLDMPSGEFAGDVVFAELGSAPRDLAYNMADEYWYARVHVRELVLDGDLQLPRSHAAQLLAQVQNAMQAVTLALGGLLDPPVVAAPEQVRRALRIIAAGAWVLPPDQRMRYREEFQGEIYELMDAGASRQQVIAYVLRQLDRMFELRAELRRDDGRR